jgi:hypothetical protein
LRHRKLIRDRLSHRDTVDLLPYLASPLYAEDSRRIVPYGANKKASTREAYATQ